MYIDFHTHAFADSIAQRAIERLEENIRNSGCEYPDKAVTDGTVADLIRMLDETGVDKAVLLPIATKPSQQTVINNWASEVMSDRLYCFGSVQLNDAPFLAGHSTNNAWISYAFFNSQLLI